jgi:hypothetical protein
MSCQSSLCWRCAKVSVDTWVSQVSKRLPEGVIERPRVLTMPERLRQTFSQPSKAVWSPFRRCGVRCVEDFFRRVSGRALQGGSIVVLQTHGRNGQDNPPLPILATSGGWDQQARQWVQLDSVP